MYLRKTVAEKLLAVDKLLKPYGVEVLLLDGWRSIELQKQLWQYFLSEAKKTMPEATEAQCAAYARGFCADPGSFRLDDKRTWVNHITGGSVDLCLCLRRSTSLCLWDQFLTMPGKISHTDYFESASAGNSPSVTDARRNRRLLYWSMVQSGFTNLPDKWWHYDYGNQLWAQVKVKAKGRQNRIMLFTGRLFASATSRIVTGNPTRSTCPAIE